MTPNQQRLCEMAALILDARSKALREEIHKREKIQQQISALETNHPLNQEIWPANALAAFSYEKWAVERRAVLNAQLAAQTAICLQAEAKARLAFGRSTVLKSGSRGRT